MTNDLKDGFWMVVIRKGKAFVPTMAQTEAGFYLATDPVFVADTSNSEDVENAVLASVRSGNPRIPTPNRDEVKDYVVLKYAGIKSLSTFERLARKWKLSKQPERFLISPYRMGQHGGFEEDANLEESIPASVPIEEVVRHLVRLVLQESGGE